MKPITAPFPMSDKSKLKAPHWQPLEIVKRNIRLARGGGINAHMAPEAVEGKCVTSQLRFF